MNLVDVRVFGEFEFCLALIKVITIVGMIILGIFLVVTGMHGSQASVRYLWDQGGFFFTEWRGLFQLLMW